MNYRVVILSLLAISLCSGAVFAIHDTPTEYEDEIGDFWEYQTGEYTHDIATDGNNLFTVGGDGTATRIQANGSIVWENTIDTSLQSVHKAGEDLYVGSEEGTIYKLDQQTGDVIWEQDIATSGIRGIETLNGDVYAVSDGQTYYTLSKDGELLNTAETEATWPVQTTKSHNGDLVTSGQDGYGRYNPDTEQYEWENTQTGGYSLHISDGILDVPTGNGEIERVDIDTGEIDSTVTVPANDLRSIGELDSHFYITTGSGDVEMLDSQYEHQETIPLDEQNPIKSLAIIDRSFVVGGDINTQRVLRYGDRGFTTTVEVLSDGDPVDSEITIEFESDYTSGETIQNGGSIVLPPGTTTYTVNVNGYKPVTKEIEITNRDSVNFDTVPGGELVITVGDGSGSELDGVEMKIDDTQTTINGSTNHPIEDGNYTITFNKDGFLPQTYMVEIDGNNWEEDIELRNGYILEGVVIDGFEDPIENATVSSSVSTSTTDENGQFTLPVENGSNTIAVSADGFTDESFEVIINESDKEGEEFLLLETGGQTDQSTFTTLPILGIEIPISILQFGGVLLLLVGIAAGAFVYYRDPQTMYH